MQALVKFLKKAGKDLDLTKVTKGAVDGAKSAKTAVKAAGQKAALTGKKTFEKFPKAGSAAAGAAAGAGTMAAADGADEDGVIKKKKKRPYLED